MAKYVIAPDVALALARDRILVGAEHQLLAPAVLRSQMLSSLYADHRRGGVDAKEAKARMDHVRALRLRLLGDRVLQATAWKVAETLGWTDTFDAEYVALTQLHGDALVTSDRALARAAETLVAVEPGSVLVLPR